MTCSFSDFDDLKAVKQVRQNNINNLVIKKINEYLDKFAFSPCPSSSFIICVHNYVSQFMDLANNIKIFRIYLSGWKPNYVAPYFMH